MAGLAIHLHYHEPSNYILVSFLRRGLFRKLCKPGKNGEFSQDIMRKMVLVLSHLIGRRFVHPSLVRRISKRSPSKVILEPLPENFAQVLSDYNRQVTSIFSQYLATVAKDLEKESGEETKLPLSGVEFPEKASIASDRDKYHALKSLANTAIPYSACSSFAALSGNTDEQLHSSNLVSAEARESEDDEEEPIDHLLKIVRQDVYTDMNVVPTLSVRGSQHLNAYALDFFKHGSSKVIERDNGIKSGEVFAALKDFYLTIKSISTSLEELEMGPESDVVRAFKQLVQEYGEKFRKQFNSDI